MMDPLDILKGRREYWSGFHDGHPGHTEWSQRVLVSFHDGHPGHTEWSQRVLVRFS